VQLPLPLATGQEEAEQKEKKKQLVLENSAEERQRDSRLSQPAVI